MKNNEDKNKTALTVKEESAEPVSDKMTIYDYEQKYVKRQNVRNAKIILRLLAAAIGIFLFACLFFVAMRVWEIN